MNLSQAKRNELYKVKSISNDCSLKERLLILGFTKDTKVKVLYYSVFKQTILVEIINGVIALRKDLAKYIEVEGEK